MLVGTCLLVVSTRIFRGSGRGGVRLKRVDVSTG